MVAAPELAVPRRQVYIETTHPGRRKNVGFFKRLFGICRTRPPRDPGCWSNQINQVIVDLAKAPELKQPGGAIRLEGQGLANRVLVMRGDDGDFHAFVNKCSHGGRRLDPKPGSSTVECCSVGKSVFTYGGERVSGSAKEPIVTLPVREESGRVIVSLVPGAGGSKKKTDSMVGTSVARG
jgi:nitrite reductase/ring-hydroxylating ferredoxin subunit